LLQLIKDKHKGKPKKPTSHSFTNALVGNAPDSE
jgi:hypothetical protein